MADQVSSGTCTERKRRDRISMLANGEISMKKNETKTKAVAFTANTLT